MKQHEISEQNKRFRISRAKYTARQRNYSSDTASCDCVIGSVWLFSASVLVLVIEKTLFATKITTDFQFRTKFSNSNFARSPESPVWFLSLLAVIGNCLIGSSTALLESLSLLQTAQFDTSAYIREKPIHYSTPIATRTQPARVGAVSA